MREQKITVPGSGGFTATQTYNYDSLNRLQSATETIASTQTWKQTFSYDRYGNRRFDTSSGATTTLGSCPQVTCNPTFSTSTNRFASGQYYTYDANGSVTEDSNAWDFTYDAEGRQTEVKDDEDTVKGQYFYDGDGRRVKKIAGGEVTIFVYGADGKLAAEYSTEQAEVPQVSYLTADHLGSPRVITNQSGAVTSRKDFSAFGEETVTAARTTALGYNPPSVRQDYTGYQKDDESGLEYAQARYYNSQHGRFTSVDPLDASATTKDPQTFNRYSYVTNSPYKFVDPLGLEAVSAGSCGNFCSNHLSNFNYGQSRDGVLSTAVESGISWSLFVWDVTAGYVLEQPDNSFVIDGMVVSINALLGKVGTVLYDDPPSSTGKSVFMEWWKLAPANNGQHDVIVDENSNPVPSNQCAIRFSLMVLKSSMWAAFAFGFKGSTISHDGRLLAIRAADVAKWLKTFAAPVRVKGPNILAKLVAYGNGVVYLKNFRGVDQTNRRFNHIDLFNAAAQRMSVGQRYNQWFDTATEVYYWSLK